MIANPLHVDLFGGFDKGLYSTEACPDASELSRLNDTLPIALLTATEGYVNP